MDDASEVDELPPGSQFGGYVVRHCIGRGGMARVYRAEHATLRKAVALKVMDSAWIGHASSTQRFLGEARAAAAVKHRNVVDIVDVGVWEGRPYLVMELLEGLDLERHLANTGPLSETEVVALALPIIAGMAAVHEEGIVHRDLKPSNIFLTLSSEGEVTPKVLDFGISRLSAHLQEPGPRPTGTREIIGTPTYMSPEALNGVRELGPAADQYSLGVVLYQCAVGRPPFQGDTLLQLLRSIALGAFPAPRAARPELSAALDAIISRAMRVEPHERFPTLRDLGRALWPLGDERTRVIWARYFGEPRLAPTAESALERSDHVALVRDRTRAGNRRSRLALGIGVSLGAVVVLAVLGGRWLSSRERRGAAPPAAAAAVRATSAAPVEQVLAAQPPEGKESQPPATPSVSPVTGAPRVDRGGSAQPAVRQARITHAERPRERRAAQPRSARSSRATTAGSSAAQRPEDPELPELFELDGARRNPPPTSQSELDGLFPEDDARAAGSNGAPILD